MKLIHRQSDLSTWTELTIFGDGGNGEFLILLRLVPWMDSRRTDLLPSQVENEGDRQDEPHATEEPNFWKAQQRIGEERAKGEIKAKLKYKGMLLIGRLLSVAVFLVLVWWVLTNL